MDTTYNGHLTKGHWNVSLWINNDEPLYRWATELVEKHGARKAARIMAADLRGESTPDRFRYTFTRIFHAIEDMETN